MRRTGQPQSAPPAPLARLGRNRTAAPGIDVGRLVVDLHRTFNPLHGDFPLEVHVTPARDGFVLLSVALPEGMTRVFVSLLESLAGLVRYADHKGRSASAQVKAQDLGELNERKAQREAYRRKLCRLFDDFTAQGQDRKQAVKSTAAALRAEKHPWSDSFLVQEELRAAGRLRRK